jgi:hydrogenase expression/formation protein HypD
MEFISQYRDPSGVEKLANAIARIAKTPHTIMEVCGGQTHSIMKYGLDRLLPPEITLLHGPGCPVCITPLEIVDKALEIASQPEVIFCSFGDMLRVPGSEKDLLTIKAEGGDVRIVYSPLDALKIAKENPTKQVIFFAVGFETTAPANAMAVLLARELVIDNFCEIVSQALIPPALKYLLSSGACQVDGFLAPGHVCTVTGYRDYEAIASDYKVPIVVTGFEPVDILSGIYQCVRLLEEGKFEVENSYSRSVQREGNNQALKSMFEVFHSIDRKWRGIGFIPQSGLGFKGEYRDFDAEHRFGKVAYSEETQNLCISGEILLGVKKPPDCPAFAKECTPEKPLGATMVSAEGACSAYFKYKSVKV